MSPNFKTVLIDTSDVFERKIAEVIEYRYDDCAIVRYERSPNKYTIPLSDLAIKHVPLFGRVND